METTQCPVCSKPVLAHVIQHHVNHHFDGGEKVNEEEEDVELVIVDRLEEREKKRRRVDVEDVDNDEAIAVSFHISKNNFDLPFICDLLLLSLLTLSKLASIIFFVLPFLLSYSHLCISLLPSYLILILFLISLLFIFRLPTLLSSLLSPPTIFSAMLYYLLIMQNDNHLICSVP